MTPFQLEQLEQLRDHIAANNMTAATKAAAKLVALRYKQAILFDVAALDILILQDVDEQDTDCPETVSHSTSPCRACGGL